MDIEKRGQFLKTEEDRKNTSQPVHEKVPLERRSGAENPSKADNVASTYSRRTENAPFNYETVRTFIMRGTALIVRELFDSNNFSTRRRFFEAVNHLYHLQGGNLTECVLAMEFALESRYEGKLRAHVNR